MKSCILDKLHNNIRLLFHSFINSPWILTSGCTASQMRLWLRKFSGPGRRSLRSNICSCNMWEQMNYQEDDCHTVSYVHYISPEICMKIWIKILHEACLAKICTDVRCLRNLEEIYLLRVTQLSHQMSPSRQEKAICNLEEKHGK